MKSAPQLSSVAVPDHAGDLLKLDSDGRIRSIDGLRGLAVLVVMLLHFNLMRPANAGEMAFVQLLGTGWIGVDLFFLVSGFLITGILWEARGSDGYFWRFYTRRTLRIFPLYYAFLFGLLVVLPMFMSQYAAEHATHDRRIWLWTYLSNILMARDGWEGMPSHTTHLWSLAIEEQFYLIWPLVVYLLRYRGLVITCLTILGLSPLIRAGLDHALPDGVAAYTLLPARLDGLALGALLALIM
ncbi:MAG: acyltransferase family protein, partial [Gemmatimonadales bacterium]